MSIEQRMAEAFIECRYAHSLAARLKDARLQLLTMEGRTVSIDPFINTLEGRRQADALEDWLAKQHNKLWAASSIAVLTDRETGHFHQWRLDRIKWCFEQLEKDHE